MDTNTSTSGEESLTKIRKPYTITKQRERWTEQEHSRFLEALRLYGRAWQRIEEHIGTKTAVQIRSHAQKFFSKLEKEAQAKGIPVGQALDIEIPPPRPKRKPSTPYPRKTGNRTPTSQVAAKDGKLVPSVSSSHCKLALDLETEPLPEKHNGDGKLSNAKENEVDNCSQVFTHLLEARCSSFSSVNKNSTPTKAALRNPITFREFVPPLRTAIPDTGPSNAPNMDNSCISFDKAGQDLSLMNIDKDDANGIPPTDDTQGTQNYPRHVPVHVVDGKIQNCDQTPDRPLQDFMFRPMGEVNGHSNSFANPAASATTQYQSDVQKSAHQPFPTFHSASTPVCHTQNDYGSFLQNSSTFSDLIVSTLLQNPAAHAAASFAASFWPYGNIGSSTDSSTCTTQAKGGFPPRQMSSPPSMAAIAAATVAAATAWWAAHGFLPLCAPFHSAFTCPPPSATAVPPEDAGQNPFAKTDGKEPTTTENSHLQDQQLNKEEQSEALQVHPLVSKSPASSSDDSEESGRTKLNDESKTGDNKDAAALHEGAHDSDKTQNKKLVDRSSCGSNTPSGSDAEPDSLEKIENGKVEVKETDENQTANGTSNRRSKAINNTSSDSWKEVSQEGRLAFQALFSREVLPQSFSPPHDMKNKENHKEHSENGNETTDKKNRDASVLDLNCKTRDPSSKNQEEKIKTLSAQEKIDREGSLSIGLGPGKNLNARRTGFKPYKRCSVEAKEKRVVSTGSQAEEKLSKRIRLEGGEAST